IEMPTFCYHSDLSTYGACRMCIVEDERGKIDAACSLEPRDGMKIKTNSMRLLKHRRMILELMLASHDCNCTTCAKSGNCRLQDLAQQFGVHQVRFKDTRERAEYDESSPAIFRDPNKCILCGDCVRVCEEMQGMNIIDFVHRGARMEVAPAFDRKIAETKCVSCGQCAAVCPTGAITVKDEIGKAWAAIHDPKLRVVVQIAPAVRVAVGEAFGIPAGANVLDKLVTALKLMGVDEVYDTIFAADLTTISEAEEFKERLAKGGPFPMFTSCCPAWVKYLENENPKYLKNISTCKSPMQMFAAVLRDKYAAKDAEDGLRTYHVAIMPCTAKKMEAAREEFTHDGMPDVDLVLTTRELIDMIRETGILLDEVELESPDLPFGMGSGAATIYGMTGGVAESVVRYCVPDKSKNALREIEFMGLRGDAPIKEATLHLGDQELKLAIVNGLVNARKLLKEIDEGSKFYHLVEVMTCQGGCVGGAGQPQGFRETKRKRGEGLAALDHSATFKRAERNPVATELLEKMGEKKAHKLLHVNYVKKASAKK
ncbi:MAG: 4Fe-4S binding protein, partial [Oscillospiraceae bacterium]|nr:4Fe-4S binding protein [Oscillospiraceae bacterium]